jgi:hypothetical protein
MKGDDLYFVTGTTAPYPGSSLLLLGTGLVPAVRTVRKRRGRERTSQWRSRASFGGPVT